MKPKKILDSLWEIPIFYKLLQITLAALGHKAIKKYLLNQIPKKAKTILDQGCGTGEYGLLFKDKYTGVDISESDIAYAKQHYPGSFIVGDAVQLKFKDRSFDSVFAVGLHHHLSDNLAKKAIGESIRVTKKGGKVVIVDAMLPKYPINILGLILRKLDRGGYVRSYKKTLDLIPKTNQFEYQILSGFPFDYIAINITV